jgi:hypothetical protein
VAQGTLAGERAPDGTVRIGQQSVTEERKRRRKVGTGRTRRAPVSGDAAAAPPKADSVDVDGLANAVAAAVGARLEGQLEITRRAESLIRQELDEERARRLQVEAQLRTAETRLAELQAAAVASAARRRGLFRRGT